MNACRLDYAGSSVHQNLCSHFDASSSCARRSSINIGLLGMVSPMTVCIADPVDDGTVWLLSCFRRRVKSPPCRPMPCHAIEKCRTHVEQTFKQHKTRRVRDDGR